MGSWLKPNTTEHARCAEGSQARHSLSDQKPTLARGARLSSANQPHAPPQRQQAPYICQSTPSSTATTTAVLSYCMEIQTCHRPIKPELYRNGLGYLHRPINPELHRNRNGYRYIHISWKFGNAIGQSTPSSTATTTAVLSYCMEIQTCHRPINPELYHNGLGYLHRPINPELHRNRNGYMYIHISWKFGNAIGQSTPSSTATATAICTSTFHGNSDLSPANQPRAPPQRQRLYTSIFNGSGSCIHPHNSGKYRNSGSPSKSRATYIAGAPSPFSKVPTCHTITLSNTHRC